MCYSFDYLILRFLFILLFLRDMTMVWKWKTWINPTQEEWEVCIKNDIGYYIYNGPFLRLDEAKRSFVKNCQPTALNLHPIRWIYSCWRN